MMLTSLPMLIIEGALFAVAAGLVYGIFGGGSGLFLMPGFYVLLRHFSRGSWTSHANCDYHHCGN